MELRNYIESFKKYAVFLISLTVVGAALAFVLSSEKNANYSVSQTFYVSPTSSEGSPQFNPSFFDQEKARNFTDTAVALIESSDFKSQLLSSGQSLSVEKQSPQLITVTAGSPTKEEAQDLITKVPASFNSKLTLLQNPPPTALTEVAPAPEPRLARVNRPAIIIAGAILGFAFAFFASSLKIYFKV